MNCRYGALLAFYETALTTSNNKLSIHRITQAPNLARHIVQSNLLCYAWELLSTHAPPHVLTPMAKAPTSSSKRRRQRRPNVPPYTGPIDAAASDEDQDDVLSPAAPASAQPSGRSARLAPTAPSAPVDFRKEYSYVLKDLRNMAIVAAAMLVLLVALNFIVP